MRKTVCDMREAMEEGDTKVVWDLARRIGARGRAAKKRRVYVQRTAVPNAGEWKVYLAQEGKDGGCRAVEVGQERVSGDGEVWHDDEVLPGGGGGV